MYWVVVVQQNCYFNLLRKACFRVNYCSHILSHSDSSSFCETIACIKRQLPYTGPMSQFTNALKNHKQVFKKLL